MYSLTPLVFVSSIALGAWNDLPPTPAPSPFASARGANGKPSEEKTMIMLMLSILAAEPKTNIHIDAPTPAKGLVVTVDGKSCPAEDFPALHAAALKYLAELEPCAPAGARVKAADLKGDDVSVTAIKGIKVLGKVACGLRPPEGAMRIKAGDCSP